jgi:hypothetical protein
MSAFPASLEFSDSFRLVIARYANPRFRDVPVDCLQYSIPSCGHIPSSSTHVVTDRAGVQHHMTPNCRTTVGASRHPDGGVREPSISAPPLKGGYEKCSHPSPLTMAACRPLLSDCGGANNNGGPGFFRPARGELWHVAARPLTRLSSRVRLAGLRRVVPGPAKGESFGHSKRVPDSGLTRPRRRVAGRCAADERKNFKKDNKRPSQRDRKSVV